jgi:hypothetical protein
LKKKKKKKKKKNQSLSCKALTQIPLNLSTSQQITFPSLSLSVRSSHIKQQAHLPLSLSLNLKFG